MAKILRLKDRVKLKIGEVDVTISPLSEYQKQEILGASFSRGGSDITNLSKATFSYIKHAVKDLKGVTDYNDKPYELQFDENGSLTDDCASEVMGLEIRGKLLTASTISLNGGEIDSIEGIEVEILPGK